MELSQSVNPPARRLSYGSHSPVVGRRGSKTRDAIVEAAYRVFRVKGVGAASIDEIAQEMSVSRATIYQYFPSKREIFYELLHDNGRDIVRLARHLGELSPTSNGLIHLRWWMLQFGELYENHQVVFQIWSSAAASDPLVGELARDFVERYTGLIAERLPTSDPDIDRLATPIMLLGVLDGVNGLTAGIGAQLGIDGVQLIENLALVVQSMIFPDFASDAVEAEIGVTLLSAREQLPRAVDRDFTFPQPLVLGTSAQRLCDAALDEFAEGGYASSTVGGIIERAGLSRTAFYRNFANKRAILVELVKVCVRELRIVFASFRDLDPVATDWDVAVWFNSYFNTYWRHAEVIAIWHELRGDDSELETLASNVILEQVEELTRFFERTPLRQGISPITAAFAIAALLDRVPLYTYLLRDVLDRELMTRHTSRSIHRGFFAAPA